MCGSFEGCQAKKTEKASDARMAKEAELRWYTRDPSLRLKNGSVRDEAVEINFG